MQSWGFWEREVGVACSLSSPSVSAVCTRWAYSSQFSVTLELLDVIYTELLIKGDIYFGPQSKHHINFQRNRNVGFIFNYKMYIGFARAGGNYKMYMFI